MSDQEIIEYAAVFDRIVLLTALPSHVAVRVPDGDDARMGALHAAQVAAEFKHADR
jgi:hypothetical protein